jgi:hypothetical protein
VQVAPQQAPFIWVTFFEENAKFGTAYMLNTNAIGMKFNDSTVMVANQAFQKLKYMDLVGQDNELIDSGAVPDRLIKKYKIITYYQR